MAAEVETLQNWIAVEWTAPRGTDAAEVTNPASGGVVAEASTSSNATWDDEAASCRPE